MNQDRQSQRPDEQAPSGGAGELPPESVGKHSNGDAVAPVREDAISAEAVPVQKVQRPGVELTPETFRTVLDALADCVIVCEPGGRVVDVNQAFREVYGYTREEAQTLTTFDLIHPDYHHVFIRFRDELLATGTFHGHTIDLRKDGTSFQTEVRGTMIHLGGNTCLVAVVRDVSQWERARAEVERLNRDLERLVDLRTAELAEANRELEAFAYSVSHDLRAPLRHADSFAQLLQQHLGANCDNKTKRYVNCVREATQRMGNLIDELLQYSRTGRMTLCWNACDTGAVVERVVRGLRSEIGRRRVRWEIGELPVVHGDGELIERIFENLLSNALKFTAGRHEAVIALDACDADTAWLFYVRDNGIGFDPRYSHKLFGLFQRLHSQEEVPGTGVGLANVRRIVLRHGGRIWAEGRPNQGAVFYFTLPKHRVRTEDVP